MRCLLPDGRSRRPGLARRWLPGGLAFVLFLVLGGASAVAAATSPAGEASQSADTAQLLQHADTIKTADHAGFLAIIEQLQARSAGLTTAQRQYLQYLTAWQIAYRGDYANALSALNALIASTDDPTLRLRARNTMANVLLLAKRYEEAFSDLTIMLDELPQVSDKDAREQALTVAAIVYDEVGQYDLALTYAEKLEKENWRGRGVCRGGALRLQALYKGAKLKAGSEEFKAGIDACMSAGELLYADAIRSYVARLYIAENQPEAAIALLKANYEGMLDSHYTRLISEYDALLALAYWHAKDPDSAQRFATRAVDDVVTKEYTEPLADAYRVLYLVAKERGDLKSALAYHEKYMDADKGYLNGLSTEVLAFQAVKQQVLAKKMQIDTLNKQNQVLQLQRAISTKAVETGRLYIILLLTIVGFIAFWAYRTKRSQLRFKKLARRDGLTGIFNRQHFMEVAERVLLSCQRTSRDACVLVIDLDHFKAVNDTHGHAVGDQVLKRTAAACQAHLRPSDVFGRIGGEEFGVLLPDCTLDRATDRAELLRLAIAALSAEDDAGSVSISASFGVSATILSGYGLRQLLSHADDALYQAKRDGRNRVACAAEKAVRNADAAIMAAGASRPRD